MKIQSYETSVERIKDRLRDIADYEIWEISDENEEEDLRAFAEGYYEEFLKKSENARSVGEKDGYKLYKVVIKLKGEVTKDGIDHNLEGTVWKKTTDGKEDKGVIVL